MIALSFAETTGLRTAATEGAEWLAHLQLWRPAANSKLVTGDVETAAVILSGTFDLIAGKPGGAANQWQARGARKTPLLGRPMAVYLPPGSEFHATGGDGEILLVGARQPAEEPVAEGRAALSQSPLLPLAGSGKAFDPKTGEWMPAETFPSSAESLPPRRMRQLLVGDMKVERVFGTDYKAATLTVDEFVLTANATIAVSEIGERPPHGELLVFVRTTSPVEMKSNGESTECNGDAAFVVKTPGGATDLTLRASGEPAYVLLAYAGK